jgi:thiamine biosynthesis lipoprotein
MRARCFARFGAAIVWAICGVAACHGPSEAPQLAASGPSASTSTTPVATPQVTASAAPATPFEPEKVTGEAKAMGTHLAYAAYTTRAVDAASVRRAFEQATAEIQRIEALMTTWRPDSDLSRVNDAAPNVAVKVSPETFDVVAESLHTSAISEGTFDITFETLHGLWKFDEDLDPHPPDAARIKAKLPLVGYKHVHLDAAARTIALDTAGTKISLGGIAKGYAVDRAAKVLTESGIESLYVQAGGDL